MPSVSARSRLTLGGPRAFGVLVAGAAAGVSLAGCVSTQQKAARLRLNSDRVRASQTRTRVTTAGRTVTVTSLARVGPRSHPAFVVTVHNTTGATVSDLPISIGYRSGHRRVYLNAGTSATFFAAHLPAIAAHRSFRWVSKVTRPLPHGARPFALVGTNPSVPQTGRGSLPSVRATVVGGHGDRLRVHVDNRSSVPQYQLTIYAIVEHGGRTVAAGEAQLATLPAAASHTASVRLIGRDHHSRARVEAPATILH